MVEELALFLTWKIQDSMPYRGLPHPPRNYSRGFLGRGEDWKHGEPRLSLLSRGVTQKEKGDDARDSAVASTVFLSLDWSFSLYHVAENLRGKEELGVRSEAGAIRTPSPSSLPLSLSFFFLRRCGKGDQSTFSHLKGRLHRVLEEHLFERKGVCRRVNSFPYRCPWLPSVWPNPGVPSFSWKTV